MENPSHIYIPLRPEDPSMEISYDIQNQSSSQICRSRQHSKNKYKYHPNTKICNLHALRPYAIIPPSVEPGTRYKEKKNLCNRFISMRRFQT
jgi:hypothetical protein